MSAAYQIYRNLSESKGGAHRWSIRQRGKVLTRRGGQRFVLGFNATFKVSEAGRQRVLRDQQKNVHAVACVESLTGWGGPSFEGSEAILEDLYAKGLTLDDYNGAMVVRYNPYKRGYFTASGTIWDRGYWSPDVCSGRRLISAAAIICDGRGMYAVRPKFA